MKNTIVNKTKFYLPVVFFLCMAGILIAVLVSCSRPVILEFGMFTGSNWAAADSDSYKIIDSAIAKFEKQHPGVHVHYYSGIRKSDYSEWFSEQVLQGKMPDVAMILGNQFNKLAAMGILKDLTPLINKSEARKSDYFTCAWNAGLYRERQYGLPYETDFMLMAANETLLEKYGYRIPDKDWTWDDFFLLCKELTKDENGDSIIDTAGVCNYKWQNAVYANGTKLFDDSGLKSYFSDLKVIESVRFMQKLSTLTEGQVFTEADFDAGKVAFMPMSFAKYRTYTSYPYRVNKDLNNKWCCLTMPAGYLGGNVSEIDTLLMGISANTKHKQLAFDLLKTFTHDREIQTDIYRFTYAASPLRAIADSKNVSRILEENMDDDDKQYTGKLLVNILANGILLPKSHQYSEAMVLADNEINRIISEKKDADNSLKVLQRAIEVKLEK